MQDRHFQAACKRLEGTTPVKNLGKDAIKDAIEEVSALSEEILEETHDNHDVNDLTIQRESVCFQVDSLKNGRISIKKMDQLTNLFIYSMDAQVEQGKIHGKAVLVYNSESYVEVHVELGNPHGFYRKFRVDKMFQEIGIYIKGCKIGPFIVRKEGSTFLIGDLEGKEITNCTYLYPDLFSAISGDFEGKVMKQSNMAEFQLLDGKYGKISGFKWTHGIPLPILDHDHSSGSFQYDPSTGMRIRFVAISLSSS